MKRSQLTQYVVELVQVVLPRKDRPVGQHLSQDAAHWPDVNGLRVALRHKHTSRIYTSTNKQTTYNATGSSAESTTAPHAHLPLSWAWFPEPCTNVWPRTRSKSLCGRARGRLSAPGRSHRSEDDTKGQGSEKSTSQLISYTEQLTGLGEGIRPEICWNAGITVVLTSCRSHVPYRTWIFISMLGFVWRLLIFRSEMCFQLFL